MAKIVIKLSTMVGEHFEIYLSEMPKLPEIQWGPKESLSETGLNEYVVCITAFLSFFICEENT